MEWDFDSIIGLAIAAFFAVLLVFFLYQIVKKKRDAPFFVTLLFFGMLGGIFAFLDSADLFADPLRIMLTIQLTCYALQFFFFFMFVENLRSLKVNMLRFGIVFGFLLLQQFALWTIVWFKSYPITTHLWLLADMGYNNVALISFLACGVPVYLKMYRYTKETKPIIFTIAIIIVSMGFIIISLSDYFSYFSTIPEWLASIGDLGDILPLTGLLLFVIVYISDVDYIYRLANDSYLLMISYKTGIPIHKVNIKNQKNVYIEDSLISGLLYTINSIFTNVLQVKTPIESISSKEATALMRSGKYIVATILTEKDSAILARALERYVKEFESRYEDILKVNDSEVSKFNSADDLLTRVFPFFIIENKERKIESEIQN